MHIGTYLPIYEFVSLLIITKLDSDKYTTIHQYIKIRVKYSLFATAHRHLLNIIVV